MRVERVILEHHGQVAVLGFQMADRAPVDVDFPGGDLVQPRDHPERGGFAAARGADENGELVLGHLEIDSVQNLGLAVALDEIFQADRRHFTLAVAELATVIDHNAAL